MPLISCVPAGQKIVIFKINMLGNADDFDINLCIWNGCSGQSEFNGLECQEQRVLLAPYSAFHMCFRLKPVFLCLLPAVFPHSKAFQKKYSANSQTCWKRYAFQNSTQITHSCLIWSKMKNLLKFSKLKYKCNWFTNSCTTTQLHIRKQKQVYHTVYH